MLSVILVSAAFFGTLYAAEQQTTIAPVVISSPCLMTCIKEYNYFPVAMDFLEKVNTQHYDDYQAICNKQIGMNACVAKCNLSSNPFDSESGTTICDAKRLEELKTHEKCLVDHGSETKEVCDTQCGGSMTDAKNKSQSLLNFGPSTSNKARDDVCRLQKCQLRCFIDALANACKNSDPDATRFMKSWLKDILKSIRNELKAATVKDQTSDIPLNCQALLDPTALFEEKEDPNGEFIIKNKNSGEVNRATVISVFLIGGFIVAIQSYIY